MDESVRRKKKEERERNSGKSGCHGNDGFNRSFGAVLCFHLKTKENVSKGVWRPWFIIISDISAWFELCGTTLLGEIVSFETKLACRLIINIRPSYKAQNCIFHC